MDMRHLTLATAADLIAWADRLESEAQLPRLVRRLIHATAGGITHIGFPADESTRGPGYDGVLVAVTGSSHVPTGASVWELSTRGDVKTKATEDYDKRVLNPRGVTPKDATYVAVTLRGWTGKDDWARERNEQQTWKEVRAFDANDLEQWLELAPAVQLWLAALLGRRPSGVLDLETFWADWCALTTPSTDAALLLAGREDVVEEIHAWLRDPQNPVLTLQAESREESVAVFAAALMQLPEDERLTYLARAAVATADVAWRDLADSGRPLILVPHGWNLGDDTVYAQRRGQRFVVPLGLADPRSTSAIAVPKSDLEKASAVLEKQGHGTQRARELAALARRSLSAFRRTTATHDLLRQPLWGRGQDARDLVPALLAGSWNEGKEGDRAVLATLAGHPYDELASRLTQWSRREDPPLRRVGDIWSSLSREDAWLVLSAFVTRSDLDRFAEQAQGVLTAPDPKFDLPDSDQWWASAQGKVPAHSDELCEGLAQTIALLGSRGGAFETGEGTTAADVAQVVVRNVLKAANKDWRVWATLSDRRILQTLAEAAPDEFISGARDGLHGNPPVLRQMFRDGEGRDPLFSSSPHTDLLWALEVLAWNPQYLTASALLFAELAAVDPGGRLMNRPIESLRAIFLSWYPQTSASHEQRMAAIDAVRKRFPAVGWDLLSKLLPEHHGSSTNTARPQWHQWGGEKAIQVTRGEVERTVGEVVSRAISDAGQDGERWSRLVAALGNFSLKNHEAIVDGLAQLDPSRLEDNHRAAIWHSLRGLVSRHHAFPKADWVIPEPHLSKITGLLPRFEPSDGVSRYAWLFTGWPELPEGRKYDDYEAGQRAIAEARLKAVNDMLVSNDVDSVVALAKQVEIPGHLGFTLGQVDLPQMVEAAMLSTHLGSADRDFRNFIQGFVDGRVSRFGSQWVLAKAKERESPLSTTQRAEMLLSLPPDQDTVSLVRELGPDAEKHFWSLLYVYRVPAPLRPEVAQALIAHGFGFAAVEILGLTHKTAPVELMLEAMEAVLHSERRSGDMDQMFAHNMLEFFERFANDTSVEPSRVAKLEWQFLALFEHRGHQPHFLHQELAKTPTFFVDVLSLVFRGKGEDKREASEDEQRRARNAHTLLNLWRTVPGLRDDGSVDAAALLEWVRTARAGCAATNRQDVGDQMIGQVLSGAPADTDGGWPCLAVRDVIEDAASTHLESGISMGVYNARGVWSKDIHEGGGQDEALAKRYEASAEEAAAHHPRTAQMLRSMAAGYRRDALRGDQDADRRQDFDS